MDLLFELTLVAALVLGRYFLNLRTFEVLGRYFLGFFVPRSK